MTELILDTLKEVMRYYSIPEINRKCALTKSEYKNKTTYTERLNETHAKKRKFIDRIPVYVSINSNLIQLDRAKFLVPKTHTIGQFLYVIKNRMQVLASTYKVQYITPDQALYVFVGNSLPCTDTLMNKLYIDHVDEDGFLYVDIEPETTFGSP